MPTELIVNGSFDVNPGQSGYGWSGTDLETTHSENTYQSNGNTSNSVAEVNGSSNQTTVMEQTFTVDNPLTTRLEFDGAIRNSANAVVDIDGYTVEVTNSSGDVIFTTTILPQTISFQQYSFEVTFPDAGDYTLTFTEIGANDSYGALVDNVSLMVCLTAGTLITTPDGPVKVEHLRKGDFVSTKTGPQRLRWIGSQRVSTAEIQQNNKLSPIRITAGALGNGLPLVDTHVSRQHRMVINSPVARRMFGTDTVFVSAIRLCKLPGIMVEPSLMPVRYFHLLFDAHQIILANGAETESLYPGPYALNALSDTARQEIETLFPQLTGTEQCPQPAAMIPERKEQIKLVAAHASHV